ncbi:MAG TPA: HD domain-containing phosphohydrolase [Solirubrobacteraceae bacterium]
MATQLQPIPVAAPYQPGAGRRLFEAVAARGINREGVELATDVGMILALDAGQMRRLEFGALLHDVGKIEIPIEIINKEGQLSQEERAAIERHTIAGQEMLEGMGGVLGEVGLVVRSTHERFDGKGYPDGLAGEAIPIEARIICCCDAYIAMSSHRPYRAALPVDEALSRLRKHRSTQFDPHVVDALIAIVQRIVQSR